MHGLECTQGLVDKVLAVVVRQILCPNNAVHIGLHQFLQDRSAIEEVPPGEAREETTYLNQVDFVEALIVAGSLDIQDRNDVLVVKVAQQLHLTQSTQTEHGVVEWGDLFDRDLLAGRLVDSRAKTIGQLAGVFASSSRPSLPDNTVGTFSDDILDLILVGHVERDLARALRGVLLTHGAGSGRR